MSRPAKFEDLTHFLIHECVDAPSKLGAIRLNKALWFSDVFAYKLLGHKITSAKYIKRQMGPVPMNILSTIENLQREKRISVIEPISKFDTRKFISISAPSTSCFSDEEIEIARYALDYVCSEAALKISEITHDVVWQTAEIGQEIPVSATLASNVAPVTEDSIKWANSVIASYIHVNG